MAGLQAAWTSFAIGLVCVVALVASMPAARRGLAALPGAVRRGDLAGWHLLGGIGGAWLVATQGLTVASLGVAGFVVAVVAGQSIGSLLVDRWGLSPHGAVGLTTIRVVSALLGVSAVAVSLLLDGGGPAQPGGVSSPAVVPALLALSAGVAVSVQQAINARAAVVAGSPWSATAINFLVGFVALGAALSLVLLAVEGGAGSWPDMPWWLYIGGPIGVAFIAMAALVVPRLGVLRFALAVILGQLSGGLVLDLVWPATGGGVGPGLLVGLALACVAVVLSARSR